jgi:hypothetical protein
MNEKCSVKMLKATTTKKKQEMEKSNPIQKNEHCLFQTFVLLRKIDYVSFQEKMPKADGWLRTSRKQEEEKTKTTMMMMMVLGVRGNEIARKRKPSFHLLNENDYENPQTTGDK